MVTEPEIPTLTEQLSMPFTSSIAFSGISITLPSLSLKDGNLHLCP